jgi:hypothetical protein
MVKDIVEPMFKTMLPGPLASLHFTKIELGPTPLVLSNVKVTKTPHDGIKLDLNVDWDGQCDIQLDADMIPKIVSKRPCQVSIVASNIDHTTRASKKSCLMVASPSSSAR